MTPLLLPLLLTVVVRFSSSLRSSQQERHRRCAAIHHPLQCALESARSEIRTFLFYSTATAAAAATAPFKESFFRLKGILGARVHL